MRRSSLAAALAIVPALFWAGTVRADDVRCRVVDGTTGAPASPESAALLQLSAGMEEVQSLKNPGSAFTFKGLDPGTMYLVQVTYKDVLYNSRLSAGREAQAEREITVYEKADDDSKVTIAIPNLVATLEQGRIKINLLVEVHNGARTVYPGGFRFSLPEGFTEVESATATSGDMPIPKDVKRLNGEPRFAVDYPLKPGRTQIALAFGAPYSGSFAFRQKFFYPVDGAMVLVAPASVSVQSQQLQPRGRDENGFAVYGQGPIAKGGQIEFALKGDAATAGAEGVGSGPPPTAGRDPMGGMPEAAGGGQVIEYAPAVLRNRWLILLLMTFVTSLAFGYGLRGRTPSDPK